MTFNFVIFYSHVWPFDDIANQDVRSIFVSSYLNITISWTKMTLKHGGNSLGLTFYKICVNERNIACMYLYTIFYRQFQVDGMSVILPTNDLYSLVFYLYYVNTCL